MHAPVCDPHMHALVCPPMHQVLQAAPCPAALALSCLSTAALKVSLSTNVRTAPCVAIFANSTLCGGLCAPGWHAHSAVCARSAAGPCHCCCPSAPRPWRPQPPPEPLPLRQACRTAWRSTYTRTAAGALLGKLHQVLAHGHSRQQVTLVAPVPLGAVLRAECL